MHEQRIRSIPHTTEESVGGYGGIRPNPSFYKEVKYLLPSSGKLLAVVQREQAPPHLLHVIELYIYDEQERVKREYLATYLPGRRETPFQTLITLYAYKDGLMAFRQFDANDDLLFEHCSGELNGKKVRASWDEYDYPDEASQITDEFIRKAYISCFSSLPRSAGPYLDPMNELEAR